MDAERAIAALRFDPLLPLWLIAALGGLAVVIVAIGVWRRGRGTVWRLLAFAVLIAWLAGPRLVQETRRTLGDIGLLAIDRSASMAIGDRAALAETARAALLAQAERLGDLDMRVITVPESGNAGTRLFTAIDKALADIPRARLAGVIAITDGQAHDVAEAGQSLGAPLHVLIPARGEETDRRIRVVQAPGYGIVGKSVTLRVAVDDLGVTARPGTATLTTRRDGERPIVETVPIGREHDIEIPIRRAGPTVVEIGVEKRDGEVSILNNRAVVEIVGVRDRLRVLLISGEPYPGERTWRRLLKADPAVDLVHFTILRPPEKDDLTPLNELALIPFPVRELFQDKIGEFDLIVLDRFQNRGLLPLPYFASIANRVRQGGALLLNVGPEFAGSTSLAATPLGSVLPAAPARSNAVINERFRPWVSPLGLRHPVTEGLTDANTPEGAAAKGPGWGSWHRRIQPGEVRGDVLLQSPDAQPLLALSRVGKGRAALLLSDQIWLWSRGHDGGGPQAELLRRIAHWLMQEPELEENALTARVTDGHLSIERRSLDAAEPGSVTVTDPDGIAQTLSLRPTSPGRGVAQSPAATPGVWRVDDGERTAYAAVGSANPLELADLRATATVLTKRARDTGGGIHWIGTAANPDIPELRRSEPGRTATGGSWIGMERRHDHVVTGIAALTLLPAWFALPLMLGLMLLAWRREGT